MKWKTIRAYQIVLRFQEGFIRKCLHINIPKLIRFVVCRGFFSPKERREIAIIEPTIDQIVITKVNNLIYSNLMDVLCMF